MILFFSLFQGYDHGGLSIKSAMLLPTDITLADSIALAVAISSETDLYWICEVIFKVVS